MISDFLKKIPAGNMVIPLLITAILSTFFPQILHFGKFTEAVFTSKGMLTVMGINLICTGAQLRIKIIKKVFKRAFTIILAKNINALLIILLVARFFGNEGILGINLLAIICASLSHNNSIFISLNYDYGDDIDLASSALTALVSGPILAMLVVGAGGIANIPLNFIIDTIIPLTIGIILGNLDPSLGVQFKNAQRVVIMFLGFSMGYNINLFDIAKSSLSGIILAFIVVFVLGSISLFFDRKINHRSGHAGLAIASTAGNAVAVPQIIASIDPSMLAYVDIATVQVASSVIITLFLTPLVTGGWMKYISRKNTSQAL